MPGLTPGILDVGPVFPLIRWDTDVCEPIGPPSEPQRARVERRYAGRHRDRRPSRLAAGLATKPLLLANVPAVQLRYSAQQREMGSNDWRDRAAVIL
jgi:hypothetical protein